MGKPKYLDKQQPFLIAFASNKSGLPEVTMPYAEISNFEIKMLSQEHIKGPLPRALSTAGSATKLEFSFTFSPFVNQQIVQNVSQSAAAVPPQK
jgi:hypothetical protein